MSTEELQNLASSFRFAGIVVTFIGFTVTTISHVVAERLLISQRADKAAASERLKISEAELQATKAKTAELYRQVDEFHGGHLTSQQTANLIRRWKTISDKKPIAIKSPRDYRKAGWLGFHLVEILSESEWPAGSEIIEHPNGDTTVFICARTTSAGLAAIELGLRENNIPCEVIIDDTFVREDIVLAIGCLPSDEPRRKDKIQKNRDKQE